MAEVGTGALRAPWAQIGGDATQAMLFHRRGAASTEMGPCRRNPKGAWRLRAACLVAPRRR